jgi:hypothetical protein
MELLSWTLYADVEAAVEHCHEAMVCSFAGKFACLAKYVSTSHHLPEGLYTPS